jgi:hypothetical protein
MVRFEGEPATHLSYPALTALGVRHAFTTRHHGNFAGRALSDGPAFRAIGSPASALHYVRQVHGTASLVADGHPPGAVGTADAVITASPDTPLAVFTADCLAVVLVDPARPLLALAHVGWRGTAAGLLGPLVATLARRFDAVPERLVAAIGPSIGPCCYEVDAPVLDAFRRSFPEDWARWTAPRDEGKWWLDLWQANTDQLRQAGLPAEAIHNARLCTACRRDLFFSYRKEGPRLSLATLAVLGWT